MKNGFHSFAVYLIYIYIYIRFVEKKYICKHCKKCKWKLFELQKRCAEYEEFHENEVGKTEVNTRVDKNGMKKKVVWKWRLFLETVFSLEISIKRKRINYKNCL